MITAIRQRTVVKQGGKIEFVSPDLPGGATVDVIVLLETVGRDTTEYLLSTDANRQHLLQALRELADPGGYVYVNLPATVDRSRSICGDRQTGTAQA